MASTSWLRYFVEGGFYNPLMAGSIDGTDKIPHDHGIVRAMKAKYKPSPVATGDPDCTIFVGRLDRTTRDEDLLREFGKYGEIEQCRVVRDIVTGLSKGYAFITYKNMDSAELAYRKGHQMCLDGHQLLVDYEVSRNVDGWVPRRSGGGFGGKKESGQLRFGGRDRPFKQPILPGSKPLETIVPEERHHSDDRHASNSKDDADRSRRTERSDHSGRRRESREDRHRDRYRDRHRDGHRDGHRDRHRDRHRRHDSYEERRRERKRRRDRSPEDRGDRRKRSRDAKDENGEQQRREVAEEDIGEGEDRREVDEEDLGEGEDRREVAEEDMGEGEDRREVAEEDVGEGEDRREVAEEDVGEGEDRREVAEEDIGEGEDRREVAEEDLGEGEDRREVADPPKESEITDTIESSRSNCPLNVQ